jgi:Tol biopolymer transport system component
MCRKRWLFSTIIPLALISTLVSAGEDKAARVTAVPTDAALLFASSMAGEKDLWGFPARELYVARSDGSGLTRITHSRLSHNHFAMSPDRKLIFTNRYSRGDTTGDGRVDYRDFKELWLIDLVALTERRVLEGIDGGYGGVGWSPDSKIVYYGIRTARGGDVQRWSVAGGTPDVVTANINELLRMPGTQRWVSDLDVSPDGRWLALLYSNGDREDPNNRRKVRIALYRIDGAEARIITDGGELAPGQHGMWPAGDFDPDFSPDGKAVSFMRATPRGMLKTKNVTTADVMRINVDGSDLALLSRENNMNQNGISSWGGPRCQIAYAVWNDEEPTYLEIVNPDGTGRKVLRFPGEVSHVQWIPVPGEAVACR